MTDYESFPPLEVVAAQGLELRLSDGRIVLDGISSWWCKSLGHRHPEVMKAVFEQSESLVHVILANVTHEPVVRLSERVLHAASCPRAGFNGPLEAVPRGANSTGDNAMRQPQDGLDSCLNTDAAPPHFGRIFFADNGSTGVEVAMKMALQAQQLRGASQRDRFITLSNAYHGETAGALSVSDLDWSASPFAALRVPVDRLEGLPYRSGPDDPQWWDASPEWPAIEAQLEACARTACAVIVEPILQAAGAMQLYSPDLLVRLRAWCDAHDVFLIADEIAAGFGRLGYTLATHAACKGCIDAGCVRDNLENKDETPGAAPAQSMPCGQCGSGSVTHCLPDFAVISKGLTGGTLPMSAVLTTQPIYELFLGDWHSGRAFMHSNTFAGHALAAAAGNAVMDIMERDGTLHDVRQRGPGLKGRLADLAATRPTLINVRGMGFVAAVDLVDPQGQPLDPRSRTGYRVYQAAVQRGALLRNLGDTMYLFPPLISSEAELDQLASILADAIDVVLG